MAVRPLRAAKTKEVKDMSICRYCGREFEPRHKNQLDCSSRCTKRLNFSVTMERRGKPIYYKTCPKCGLNFRSMSDKREFCFECLPSPNGRHKDIEVKKPRNRIRTINQINKAARKSGVSYGKYVAAQNMKPLERRNRVGLSEIQAGKGD